MATDPLHLIVVCEAFQPVIGQPIAASMWVIETPPVVDDDDIKTQQRLAAAKIVASATGSEAPAYFTVLWPHSVAVALAADPRTYAGQVVEIDPPDGDAEDAPA